MRTRLRLLPRPIGWGEGRGEGKTLIGIGRNSGQATLTSPCPLPSLRGSGEGGRSVACRPSCGLLSKHIAAELITQVRKSVTIDWTLREGARAEGENSTPHPGPLPDRGGEGGMVKRILNKYGYPPDLQEEAVKTVLQQAELLCAEWGAA